MLGKQPRLIGIDLFRGLAIYAVVIVHTDEGITVLPPVWAWITNFSLFAVPFFLATSFYLSINKLYLSRGTYPLRSRLIRLLLPYGFWTALYLLYKVARYAAAREPSKLLNLFNDPLSLFFFGGAAFHLYFLPLLITGTFLLKFSEILIKREVPLKGLALIGIVCILIYELLLVSGSYPNNSSIPFQMPLASVFPAINSNPLLRWMLVELSYILRCLPYVLVGMCLFHPNTGNFWLKLPVRYALVPLFMFFICNVFGSHFLPQSVHEITRGYTALVAAIALSNCLKDRAIIRNIGLCSFGIYLIHLFFVEVFQSIAVHVYPDYFYYISTASLIVISITILLVSWVATILLMKRKSLSWIMFGN
jgi:peptidoglycan/LPS O-acetylase OafA/YrhL